MELATVSNIAFGVGGTLLGVSLKHVLETRRRKREDFERWHSETRKHLMEVYSIGVGVLAANDITENEIERLEELAAKLRTNGEEGRNQTQERVYSRVFDIGEVVGIYTKIATNDKDETIGEYINGVVEIQERYRPQIGSEKIEEPIRELGGLPLGQRGVLMKPEQVIEQIETFVEHLQPGMEPEDVNTLSDMKEFEWGFIDDHLSREEHEQILEQIFPMFTQMALVQIPAETQSLVQASESGEINGE